MYFVDKEIQYVVAFIKSPATGFSKGCSYTTLHSKVDRGGDEETTKIYK
jgi:hypothetical protein